MTGGSGCGDLRHFGPKLEFLAWGTTKVAVIEGRIGTLERAVENGIIGYRSYLSAEMS